MLVGIAGIKFLIKLRQIHTFAIVKAHVSFYKNLPLFLKKRRKLYKKQAYFLHISIVWQYFVLGRNKFKDLD